MWKRIVSFVLAVTMVFGMMSSMGTVVEAAGTGTGDDPIVVYRNPYEDYAADQLNVSKDDPSSILAALEDFEVTKDTRDHWFTVIKKHYPEATDVLYTVNNMEFSLYKKTNIPGYGEQPCYKWFGWEAVNNGTATETVKIVKDSGDIIDGIVVKVRNHIDVTWNYYGKNEPVKAQHALGSAINDTDSYEAIENDAISNPPDNKYFAGWATSADATEPEELGLDKVIDVTNENGALAAEAMNGKTFYAVYQDNPKLPTRIDVSPAYVELKYGQVSGVDEILDMFEPVVKSINGSEVNAIDNADFYFVYPEDITGIGTHDVIIRYDGSEEYYASDEKVTVTITNKKKVENPVVVYRNPAEDYAADEVSLDALANNRFIARDSSVNNWIEKVAIEAELKSVAANMQFYVNESGVEVNANLKGNTSYGSYFAPLGGLFGWEAVAGGEAGEPVEEKVNLLDEDGTVIATDIPVTVKGYVDVTWNYYGKNEPVKAQHALGSAINDTDSYEAIENDAISNPPDNKYFAGWATSADATEPEELGLDKVIDVTNENGALAAEAMNGKTFYAVYQDNPKLPTRIDVSPAYVELKYGQVSGVDEILDMFEPVVKSINGSEVNAIDNADFYFVYPKDITGIGTHDVIIRYDGNEEYYAANDRKVTVTITNKKDVEESVIVYRNPKKDTAGNKVSTDVNELSKFQVRPEVIENWMSKLSTAADLENVADTQFKVTVSGASVDAYFKTPSNVAGTEVMLRGLFGWKAVADEKAGAPVDETVNLLDKNGILIATEIPVTVKGSVNITWNYGEGIGAYSAMHPLGSAIYGSDEYKLIEQKASDATPNGKNFAGWKDEYGNVVANADLMKVIDVIQKDGTILADDMDERVFTAVYQDKPVFDTRIVVAEGPFEFEYSNALTEATILERINPKVVAIDVNGKETTIGDADDIDFTCSTGIGTHTVILQYKGEEDTEAIYRPRTKEVTVIIKGKVIDKTIVVYRNPVHDPAPSIDFDNITKDDVTLDLFKQFIVRPETKTSWLEKAAEVAEVENVEDLQLNVKEYIDKLKEYGVELDLEYVNIIKPTENSLLGNLPLGNLFGFQAVQGGAAEKAEVMNVRIVGENDKVIADGLNFQVKGYVDIIWKYGDQKLERTAALNKTILTADYDTATINAINGAEKGYKFVGWDIDSDGKEDDVSTYFMTIVDVTSDGDALAAKDVDGKTFTAIYEEGEQEPVVEKLATTIIPSKTEVTLTYSSELTEEAILKEIAPVVKASNGNEVVNAKILISCDVAAGTQTAILSYDGDVDNYKPAEDVTVTVIIKKATPEMSVSSHTLKYGQTVTEEKVYSANCDTIKFMAGLDVHDPQKLISKVQLALPNTLMVLVEVGKNALGLDIDLKNLTIQQLQAIIDEAEKAGTSLGTYEQYLNYLNKVEELLNEIKEEYGVAIDLTISISDEIVMPTAIGVYAAGMMVSDNNYESDMAAGYILITPATTQTTLSWNATDDNFVIALDKVTDFDFTAKASDAEADSKIEYVVIGVDSNKEFVVKRVNAANENVSKVLNAVGVYAQIAYVADFGNEMFYAEPIIRPILVSPAIADVKFVDANGDESLAEVFEYGDEISFDVTVDGSKNPAGTLYVKYTGSDITASGWYRDEVPSEPGMYTAVAVYGEKNADGEVVKLGGAVKAFVIEKADADLSMSDVTVEPDGKEHFTEISDKTMTYVTVALDDTENAYINIPSDIEEKLESGVKKLPAKAENVVSEFLKNHVYSYIGSKVEVDGEEYKEALDAMLQKLIDLDLSGEAKAEIDALYEAVADKIAEYDIQSMITAKIEAEATKLNNYVTGFTPDILDDPLKKVMEAAIVIDGTDVYLDKAAAEAVLNELIADFSKDIDDMTTEELMAMAGVAAAAVVVDKILAQNEGLDFIEVKVEEIKAELSKIRLDDPKELAKQVIGALDDYLDEDELAKVYNQLFVALDESGYVTELVTIIEGLAEMCGADASEAVNTINSGLNNLIKVLIGKTKNGTLTKEDFRLIEAYIDNVLTELKYLVEDLPDGTYYFGTNPSKTGVYNCFAINISKYHKSEVLQAVLNIQKNEVVRVYGKDRYLTSLAVCDELKEKKGVDEFDTLILATGTNFADAMSATYLSYVADAPILLINQGYAGKVVEYLNNSLSQNGKVYVIGGTAVIKDEWLDAIDTDDVKRLSGKDRYETNLRVLEAAVSEEGCLEEILICSGKSYADCISASATKKPIFLVNGKEPTENQKAFLRNLDEDVRFYVVGGDAAVSEAMEEYLKGYGTVVDRVKGKDRYGTSYNVATKLVSEVDSSEVDSLIITYGLNFPDGICGGLLATTTNAAIVLASPGNTSWADRYVDEKGISAGYVLGGASLIADNAVADIFDIQETEILKRYRVE